MSEHIVSGSYVDYDRPWGRKRQWLVSEMHSTILSNFLAVCLAIAIQRGLFAIAKRIILATCAMSTGVSANLDAAGQSGPATGTSLRDLTEESNSAEGLSLRSFASFLSRVVPGFIQVGTDTHNSTWSRVFGKQFWFLLWENVKDVSAESSDLLLTLGVAFLMALIYFGSILVGVYLALVNTTTVAVSAHPGCNIYAPGWPGGNPSFTNLQKYYHQIEAESGEYARRCYNTTGGSDGCNYFYKKSIPFSATENATCPFRSGSGDLCFDGPSSALTLTTGRIRPEAIGINTPLKYTFERETTCSPLRMDGGLIQRVVDDKNKIFYRYFYGTRVASQFGCPSNLINCTYELPMIIDQNYKAYSAQWRNPMDGSIQTPPSLPLWDTNGTDDTSSIILVQNIGIAYPDRREDPIFPAEKTYDNGTWFYNTRWHAGVLGCVDRTTICSPNGTVCGSLQYWTKLEPSDTDEFRVVVMLFWSLLQSNIGTAMTYRAAEALEVQTKIVASFSLQLALEQWKIEVQELFKTSLARIQVDARNIARGPPSGNAEGLQSFMRPFYQGICRMYKFNSIGWRNVSVSAFMGAISAGLLIIILGVHGKDEQLWIEGPGTKVIKFSASKWGNHCQPRVTILSASCGKGLKVLGRFIWDQLCPKLNAFYRGALTFFFTCINKLVECFLELLSSIIRAFPRGMRAWNEIDRLFRFETSRRQETTIEL